MLDLVGNPKDRFSCIPAPIWSLTLFQAKNIWQAEIDAGAEMIDFLRFNVQFARVSIFKELT